MPNSGFIKFNTKDITTVIHEETANVDGYAKEADILKACDDAITNEVNVGQVDLATVLSAVAELQTKAQAYETELQKYDYVIESNHFKDDTQEYWYEKYKSGRVEQYGFGKKTANKQILQLPVEMQDLNYFAAVGNYEWGSSDSSGWESSNALNAITSTTQIEMSLYAGFWWIVKGYSKDAITSDDETGGETL